MHDAREHHPAACKEAALLRAKQAVVEKGGKSLVLSLSEVSLFELEKDEIRPEAHVQIRHREILQPPTRVPEGEFGKYVAKIRAVVQSLAQAGPAGGTAKSPESARPVPPGETASGPQVAASSEKNVLAALGVQPLDPSTMSQLNLPSKTTGVVINHVEPGSPAEAAGLQRGGVIQEVNREVVKSLEDFQRMASKIKKEEMVVLLLSRQGNNLFVAVDPR